jgi:tetratricopeptide (TPR) repeat protein
MSREDREAWWLGHQRLDEGDLDGALTHLAWVAERCPRYADVHYTVGLVHERRGDLEAAATSLERALEINPGYAEALLALSSVYERRGLFERARHLAERARRASAAGPVDATTRGKLANLHAVLGDAYREAGEPREAVEAYRKALDRCPAFHDIRHRLGIALREAGLPAQALAEFRRVLRANPSYLESAVQLGLTYYTLGRSQEALGEWRAVLKRDPGREDARMYVRLVEGQERRPPVAQGAGPAASPDATPDESEPFSGI